ncbi:MAG: FG-GAP-like repeat-containing protein [Balneolaceae bacterium]|nr:FG-GAP-like repeat-containing protein [Balneolaceae bacterium]
MDSLKNTVILLTAAALCWGGCSDLSQLSGPVIEGPIIQSVIPASGAVGDRVLIGGKGFGSGETGREVYFGTVLAPVESSTDSTILTQVPTGAQTGPIQVVIETDTAKGPTFTVDSTNGERLTINRIQPSRGRYGDQVDIYGTGFSPDTSQNDLFFNNTPAALNSATDTSLTAIVPAGAQTGPVIVIVDQDTAVGPEFTIIVPEITSISPTSGPVGTEVTISGNNFSPDTAQNDVTFNGVDATVESATESQLVTRVPDGATDGPVEVTISGATATGPEFNVITGGTLEAGTSTTGSNQDPDGYILVIDSADSLFMDLNDTIYVNELNEGTHQVELSGIASNCNLVGNTTNPRDVNITEGDTTSTSFSIDCIANQPPAAMFTWSCTELTCNFDGSGSSDSDGSITRFEWDFGDGNTDTTQTASHTYQSSGTFMVKLTVTDDDGATDETVNSVSVTKPVDDDDLDLVVGTPQHLVFTNDGSGNFTQSVELANVQSIDIELADIDMDNDLDIIVQLQRSRDFWLNDGTGSFTLRENAANDNLMDNVIDIELADLNGDGYPDIYEMRGTAQSTDSPNWVWLNDGTGSFSDSGQRLGTENGRAVDLGDINGDGFIDAIVANDDKQFGFGNNANIVWLNDGSGNFSDSGLRLGNNLSQDVKLGDLDGDGDLDAFVFNDDVLDVQENRVYFNQGDSLLQDSGQRLGSYRSIDGELGDVDGDGDLDAFFGTWENGCRVWLNDGEGNFSNSNQVIGSDENREIKLGDFDGDGDLDALVINDFSSVVVWFNDGTGQYIQNVQVHDEGGESGDIGDLD